jgi:hypothetical protein
MKRSSTSQALAKAQRAFDKASRALPEYEALQKAQAAHGPLQASLVDAQPILRALAKRKRAPKSPFPDPSLFREEYDAQGPIKVRRLFDDMKAIEYCLREVESERRRAAEYAWRREEARKVDFTDEERRLILSTLHPDANASPDRREAAFKAFNAKRGAKPQP